MDAFEVASIYKCRVQPQDIAVGSKHELRFRDISGRQVQKDDDVWVSFHATRPLTTGPSIYLISD